MIFLCFYQHDYISTYIVVLLFILDKYHNGITTAAVL